MNHDREFDHLCEINLDGSANDQQIARFQELLRDNESARLAYTSQARIHALLTFQNGVSSEELENEPQIPASRKQWRWQPIAAIAAAIIVFIGILIAPPNSREQAGGVAFEVINAKDQSSFQAGQSFRAEELKIEEGSLTFRLDSGAQVELQAPAELLLKDSMHITVLSGAVTVDVGENANGFTVDTDNARVVDLGTRFGVVVGDSETDVVVFEGEVDVFKPNSNASESKLANLHRGEAVRVDSQWVAKRLQAVSISGESLAIMGGNRTKKPTITRVSDDINDVGFHRFYSIHPRAMREGMLAYATHGMPRWAALPNQDFPGRLRGADTVRTFSPDSKNTDLNLTIDLAEPCDVFILLDSRSNPPSWVLERFKKTPHQLRSGPWQAKSRVVRGIEPDANEELFVHYQVWKLRIKKPGSLTLGPPRHPSEPLNRAMYGIAVKSLQNNYPQ